MKYKYHCRTKGCHRTFPHVGSRNMHEYRSHKQAGRRKHEVDFVPRTTPLLTRPFACKVSGCTRSFRSIKGLNVHHGKMHGHLSAAQRRRIASIGARTRFHHTLTNHSVVSVTPKNVDNNNEIVLLSQVFEYANKLEQTVKQLSPVGQAYVKERLKLT